MPIEEPKIRKCVICGKPLKKKGWYCGKCIKDTVKLNESLTNRYKLKYPIKRSTVAKLAQMYPDITDIFDFLSKHPSCIFQYFHLEKSQKDNLRSRYKVNKNTVSDLSMKNIPKYIKNYFLDNDDMSLLEISGNDKCPVMKVKCNRCGKIMTTTYKEINKSAIHQCDATISRGEYLVKKYLEDNHVEFKTQRDTLKCINPKTSNVLPYDFELSDKKTIIEVQGNQHVKYTPYFHRSEDSFAYQKYKDAVKKDFAERMGYRFIEIFYTDINNGNYKEILKNVI